MMKPKIALVKDGFLPAGSENVRGRLSREAIERCKELAGTGWKIEGYTVSQSDTAETVITKSAPVDPNRVFDIPDEQRSEHEWEAFTSEGTVGMRTVCNTCGSSLTYCWCEKPRVWLDSATSGVVYFKTRKTPLKTNRWW